MSAACILCFALVAAACAEEDGDEPLDLVHFQPPRDVVVVSPGCPDGVTCIDVVADAATLSDLHRNPTSNREEYDVVAVVNGHRYDDVEIELHGGFARTVPKLSYRLRFADDDPLSTDLFSAADSGADEDHERIVLHGSWIDPTFMRNCATMNMVLASSGYAPRCSYAQLSFNGAYQGLYIVFERIDRVFLERNGLDPSGLLLKAENHDANWADKENPLDGFSVKYNFGVPTDALGTLLARIADTERTWAAFEQEVASRVSIDGFMTYQAMHTLAGDQDAFTKNYYLHLAVEDPEAVFEIISWDADATWGISWDGTVVEPRTRLFGTDTFSRVLFSIPEYRQQYESILRGSVDEHTGLESTVADWVDDTWAVIGDQVVRDHEAWERNIDSVAQLDALRAAVAERFDETRELFDDDDDGHDDDSESRSDDAED